MNISKFLFIDAASAIVLILLLFLFQARDKKIPSFFSSTKEKLLEKTTYEFPNKEKLLDLEMLSRSQGSGIEFDSLVGDWKFISVWKRDADEEDSIFSSLLRFFSAKLKLKKDISTESPIEFSIITSIQFGFFTIEFSGSAYLKGKQPLLSFFFNLIELKSGPNILFSRSLDEPSENAKPFFSLIALGENCGWFSARGQGGAIVLWLKL